MARSNGLAVGDAKSPAAFRGPAPSAVVLATLLSSVGAAALLEFAVRNAAPTSDSGEPLRFLERALPGGATSLGAVWLFIVIGATAYLIAARFSGWAVLSGILLLLSALYALTWSTRVALPTAGGISPGEVFSLSYQGAF